MRETQFSDKKSLLKVVGKTADWKELAKDCVCFANSRGGKILIGIEDKASQPIPVPFQGDDSVEFTVNRRISKPEIITLISRADEQFQLNSKEIISLGLIAQHNSLSAIEFSKELNLPEQSNVVGSWLGRLIDLGLIISKGKTKGTEYFVNQDFLKKTNFKGPTNLKRIENHRLEELIYQDVRIYAPTSIEDIHTRIGKEISRRKIQFMLKSMCGRGVLSMEGVRSMSRYSLNKNR